MRDYGRLKQSSIAQFFMWAFNDGCYWIFLRRISNLEHPILSIGGGGGAESISSLLQSQSKILTSSENRKAVKEKEKLKHAIQDEKERNKLEKETKK